MLWSWRLARWVCKISEMKSQSLPSLRLKHNSRSWPSIRTLSQTALGPARPVRDPPPCPVQGLRQCLQPRDASIKCRYPRGQEVHKNMRVNCWKSSRGNVCCPSHSVIEAINCTIKFSLRLACPCRVSNPSALCLANVSKDGQCIPSLSAHCSLCSQSEIGNRV